MAKTITITDGTGTSNIGNGNYTVTSSVLGYDNSSITPSTVNIVEGTNSYAFTISASGTLTLHVTEDGTQAGTAVVGATFVRTDANGMEYGTQVTTDTNGDAVLANVPYGDNAPVVYYKQTGSDGNHDFSTTVQSATLSSDTLTVEITNALYAERTISLTDTNYANLPVSGELILNS